MKSKTIIWSLFAGILWMLVGLRDTFAPSFFSFKGRVVTNGNIVFDFAVAAVFPRVAAYTASTSRHLNGNK